MHVVMHVVTAGGACCVGLTSAKFVARHGEDENDHADYDQDSHSPCWHHDGWYGYMLRRLVDTIEVEPKIVQDLYVQGWLLAIAG